MNVAVGGSSSSIQFNKGFARNVMPTNKFGQDMMRQPERLAGSVWTKQPSLQSGVPFLGVTSPNNESSRIMAVNANSNTSPVDHSQANLDGNVQALNNKIKNSIPSISEGLVA